MATFTTNYNLRKPDNVDDVDVETDINDSMDIIDTTMKAIDNKHTSGTAFPVAPSEGFTCYRTDEDKFYVYDGASWDEIWPALTHAARIFGPTALFTAGTSFTVVPLPTVTHDEGMDTATANTIIIARTGWYALEGQVTWVDSSGVTGSVRSLGFQINGVNESKASYYHDIDNSMVEHASDIRLLAAGDTIKLVAAAGGANANISASSAFLTLKELK